MMWFANSTNGVRHVIVNGYYMCNHAVGKIPKSRRYGAIWSGDMTPWCENCLKIDRTKRKTCKCGECIKK